MANQTNMKYINDLNDLVIKKLISLGTNHKEEFKQVLGKSPEVKVKIENAFKLAANTSSGNAATRQSFQSNGSYNTNNSGASSNTSGPSSAGKAPKIQLKTFGNFK